MLNMKNREYTKINLRDFRHNLTQLKDSLASGEVYEVVEKGNPLGYFVPFQYDIKLKEKIHKPKEEKSLHEILESMPGKFELNEELPNDPYYEKTYRKQLMKRYKIK